MAIDDIDQAALAARWGGAEADLIDAICGVLDEPRPTVIRVLHAASVLRDRRRYGDLTDHMDQEIENELGFDLRAALRDAMERGLRRVIVRRAIAAGAPVRVSLKAIVQDQPIRMCAGCPVSIRCAALGLSTPQACASLGRMPIAVASTGRVQIHLDDGALARPVRLMGDRLRVACDHPRGTWDVEIMDVIA